MPWHDARTARDARALPQRHPEAVPRAVQDALLSETTDDWTPVALQQVAGFVVVGNEEYLSTDDREWTHSTGDAMAHVLVHAARALAAAPIPKPPNA